MTTFLGNQGMWSVPGRRADRPVTGLLIRLLSSHATVPARTAQAAPDGRQIRPKTLVTGVRYHSGQTTQRHLPLNSHWYHWAFEFPSPIDPPIPYRGRPGLWVPSANAVQALRDIL
jgi:hypothetical protein